MLLLLAACDFSAATTVLDKYGSGDSADGGTGGDTDAIDSAAESGGENVVDTSAGDSSSEESGASGGTDADQDGWPVGDDCDDANPTVHPGVTDDCDGVDSDCDGTQDEDAAGDDPYEPNDDVPYELGSLEDDPARSLTGWLTNVQDIDRFSFEITDDVADFFVVTATLSNVPEDALWLLELNRIRSDGDATLGTVASDSGGGTLEVSFGDEVLVEDGGEYELVISALSGADCARAWLLGLAQ